MTSRPLTIAEQADFVEALAKRAHPEPGDETRVILSIEGCVADELRALAARLKRMAPHEAAIRKLVVGSR